MFKRGSIRKIQVENFVTYSYAEMYPGPNLNLLIGPNGTGKSTMVAAIILGLGGNPKTVGRGTKISEYIKHGCSDAKINIQLQGENDELIIVSRHFGADEKSVWRVNDKKVTQQNFKEFVRQYDIQVDNLCQFLPQDRVQDFAKLNKQELLRETQIAICRMDLIEKQQDLITGRSRHKKLLDSLQKWEDNLTDETEANLRLQGKIQNFRKKMEFSAKVKNIERKVAWVVYDVLKERLDEVRQVRQKAQDDLNRKRQEVAPLQTAVNNARRAIDGMLGKISNLGNHIRKARNDVITSMEESTNLKRNIATLESERDVLLVQLERQTAEIRGVQEDLQKVESDKAELLQDVNEQSVEQKLEKYRTETRTLQKHIRTLEDAVVELTDKKRNKFSEMRYLQNEVTRLENSKQQRLDKLKTVDANVCAAVNWLRLNKQLFKGEVFEPMMLEINVLNPEHSIYLENVIPKRDKLAFTCTNKEDMTLLIKAFRQNQWNCNVLHSGNDGMSIQDFEPAIPIEHLRRFGFYSYLISLFTAPEPIMKYLCRMYNVHQVPVGTEVTNQMFKNVPKSIALFFSHNSRYTVTFSRYTGEKSIRQNVIISDGTLSITVDTIKIEQTKGQINDLKTACDRYENEINDVRMQIAQVNDKIANLREKSTTLESKRRQLQNLQNRTRLLQTKLQTLQENTQSGEEIRLNTKNQIENIVTRLINVQLIVQNHYKVFLEKVKKQKIENLKLFLARKEVDFLTNKFRERQHDVQAAEQTLENLKLVYNDIKGKANENLQNALLLSNNCTRDQPGFEEFRESYEELTANVEELEAEKEELQSRIDCLQAADGNEVEEYERRKLQIEKLRRDIEAGQQELGELVELLNASQEQWLGPLQEIVQNINQKFGDAFERMSCAGEVSICKGADENDYEQYGLSIKVSYRDGETLQELNTTVQSGGERAVATAAFMLSLQELTPVPFRCVDEINQGMDAPNERRIFDLLIESTSKENTAQYFLITPKLVPGLRFVNKMKVHIVHNGPFLAPANEWSKTRLCNPEGF